MIPLHICSMCIKKHLSWQTGSRNLTGPITLPIHNMGGGYTVLPLSVLRPSKIVFVAFFSATIDGRNLIFGHKLHIGMPYCGWEAFLDPSDSYFLFANLGVFLCTLKQRNPFCFSNINNFKGYQWTKCAICSKTGSIQYFV
jgi:hypothetical protein